MAVSGGCLCGAVRYSTAADPIMTRICWCRLCQYLAAGNGTVNVVLPSAGLQITGPLHDWRSIADSGNVMHRRFCPDCGTHLFSEAEVRPHLVIVRAGTLDDRDLAKPSMNIWTAAAPSWACISDAIPEVPGQPPPAG